VSARKKAETVTEIRRDDVWEFTTNNGVLVRHVRSVTSVVSYLANGIFRQCSIAAFKRWTKGAELTFRAARPDPERRA
jgi:hypothetical protein